MFKWSVSRVRKVLRYDLLAYLFEPTGATNFLLYIFIDISKAISRKRYKIAGKLVLITDRKSYMSFRLVPKSVTFYGEMALFCVILPNLVVCGAYCIKVVDKAITMDNLRLLCLVVNVCRGTARRQRYKFRADS